MSLKPNFQPHQILNDYDEEEFKKNLPSLSQEKLCEIIVCNRYLGIMHEASVLAMEELSLRRSNGEIFNFEDRIIELQTDLPEIDLDINKMLKSFRI